MTKPNKAVYIIKKSCIYKTKGVKKVTCPLTCASYDSVAANNASVLWYACVIANPGCVDIFKSNEGLGPTDGRGRGHSYPKPDTWGSTLKIMSFSRKLVTDMCLFQEGWFHVGYECYQNLVPSRLFTLKVLSRVLFEHSTYFHVFHIT